MIARALLILPNLAQTATLSFYRCILQIHARMICHLCCRPMPAAYPQGILGRGIAHASTCTNAGDDCSTPKQGQGYAEGPFQLARQVTTPLFAVGCHKVLLRWDPCRMHILVKASTASEQVIPLTFMRLS